MSNVLWCNLKKILEHMAEVAIMTNLVSSGVVSILPTSVINCMIFFKICTQKSYNICYTLRYTLLTDTLQCELHYVTYRCSTMGATLHYLQILYNVSYTTLLTDTLQCGLHYITYRCSTM